MIVFRTIVGLSYEDTLVGVRVHFGKRQYDISVEALESGGLVGFKPQKGLKLKPHGALLLSSKEIASGEHVADRSDDTMFVKSFISYARLIPRIIDTGVVEGSDNGELLAHLDKLRGKHLFTKTLGDGELELVVRKKDGSGIEVWFHSNGDGQIILDAEEFYGEVVDVKEITS
jgi:hypothetical protein